MTKHEAVAAIIGMHVFMPYAHIYYGFLTGCSLERHSGIECSAWECKANLWCVRVWDKYDYVELSLSCSRCMNDMMRWQPTLGFRRVDSEIDACIAERGMEIRTIEH